MNNRTLLLAGQDSVAECVTDALVEMGFHVEHSGMVAEAFKLLDQNLETSSQQRQ